MEEWEEQQNKEDEVDLVGLVAGVWDQRRFVAKVTGAFVLFGLIVALLSPVEYQVSATLLPESQSSQSLAGSLLQQYGGLLGGGSINLGQDGSISPQFYPTIVQSLPFQLELLKEEVHFSELDTTMSVYTYFDEIYTPSVFYYIRAYTLGLPRKIMNLFSTKQQSDQEVQLSRGQGVEGFKTESIYFVTGRQMSVISKMRERISANMDRETGTLQLVVEMQDPRAAAEIGQASIKLLKEHVISYRTEKAMQNLEFAKEQKSRAEARFTNAQNRLAEFRDSNMNLATAKAQTQEERLQSEYELAFNLFNSLAQQVEQAELRVQEETPVVNVLQPIQVPLSNSKPNTPLIVILSLFLGFFASLAILFSRRILDTFKHPPTPSL